MSCNDYVIQSYSDLYTILPHQAPHSSRFSQKILSKLVMQHHTSERMRVTVGFEHVCQAVVPRLAKTEIENAVSTSNLRSATRSSRDFFCYA